MQSPNHLPSEILLAYRNELINRLLDQIELIDDIQNSELMIQISKSANDSNKLLTHANLEESKAILKGEIAKLEHFDVVLSVVGTMKAGKSTTINAIVGQEILPNRNEAMTTLPTLIRHTPGQSEPVLTFNSAPVNSFAHNLQKLLQAHPACKTPITEENLLRILERIEKEGDTNLFRDRYDGEAEIFAFLVTLNDIARLAANLAKNEKSDISAEAFTFPYAQYRNLDDLPLITVAFISLDEHENHLGTLTLLDTPGPDEAGQEHLKPMLDEQLRRSSAVIFLLNYAALKTSAEADIRTQLAQLPHIDSDNLFAWVNRFDQKDTNSDNEEQTCNLVHKTLLKDRVLYENIFPIAAKKAFLARRMAAEIARIGGKPNYKPGSWIEDFVKTIYPNKPEQKWERAELEDIHEEIADTQDASLMAAPMEKVILKTRSDAWRISIRSALRQSKSSLDNIHNALEIHNKAAISSDEELAKLRKLVAGLKEKTEHLHDLEKRISKDLQNTVKELAEHTNFCIQELQDLTKKEVSKAFHNMIEEFTKATKDETITLKEFFSRLEFGRAFSFTGRRRVSEYERESEIKEIEENFSSKDIDCEITFKSKKQAERFVELINNIYHSASKHNNNISNEILREVFKEMEEKISHTEKEIQNTLHLIQKSFTSNNIDIKLENPPYPTEFIQEYSVQYTREMKEKEITKKVASDGWWAWVKRTLGFGGYEEITEINYTDTRRKIEEQIINDLTREVYLPTQEKVDEIIYGLKDKVMQSVATLKSGIAAINNELDASIAMSEGEIADKAAWIATVQGLHRRNKMINEDIDAIRKTFVSQEIRA